MIPSFPAFKKLDLSDRPHVESCTRPFASYSDYNFASLWCWDTSETCQISLLHGNLVVQFKDYESDDHFYSFIGNNALMETTEVLITHAERQGIAGHLRLIPEVVVQNDPRLRQRFLVQEDRENFDYVCRLPDMAALVGRPYETKRHEINRFRRLCEADFLLIDLSRKEAQDALLALFDLWVANKHPSAREESHFELSAIKRLFTLGTFSDLVCQGIFIQDVLRGFAISERRDSCSDVLLHFWKADINFPGIYSQLAHLVASHWVQQGAEFLNWEQDLGHPGMAQAKQSWRPCHFLKKYTISPNS